MANANPARTPGPWAALAILTGLNLALFGDVLFNGGGRVLSSDQADLFLHFAVWRQFALDQLRLGHFPLWNPHYLCGSPFLGNFESALLYPFFWLGVLVDLPLALNLSLVGHVLLAGFLTFLWGRNRDISFSGSLLSGIVFMWGGAFFLHLYAGHLPNLTVMAWAPFYFLSLDKLLEEEGHSWFFWGVLALSLQVLGGHPQYVYFTSILGVLYVLLSSRGKVLRSLGRFTSIYLGAGLITAVQWGPGLEAYLESARRIPMDSASARAFSFPPENILTLFLPDLFGTLYSSPYWGRWYLWEVSLFIGLVPFTFAWIGSFSKGKHSSKWVILAVVSFFLSLGAFTPLFSLLFQWIPGFKSIRGLCKFDFLVALFLALLAGQGFDYIRNEKKDPTMVIRWLAISGIFAGFAQIVLIDSLAVGWEGLWGRFFSNVPWLVKTLSNLDPGVRNIYAFKTGIQFGDSLFWGDLVCVCFCFFLVLKKITTLFLIGTFSLMILELFFFARANRPTFEFSSLQNRFAQVRAIYQKDLGDYRVYGSADAAMGMGGYDIWEDEPMVPLRYAQFICRSQGIPENRFFSTAPMFDHFNKAFSLVRLKYLFNWGTKGLEAYRLPFQPLPRMLLLSHWEAAEGTQALDRLLDKDFDLRGTVLLKSRPDPQPAGGKVEGKVEWRDLSTDSIEVTADNPKPEILLVTDNYAGGWKVEAFPGDPQTTYQVLPGDHFLRAVPLLAGHHHFLMVYRPIGFEVGKWVSILSCLLFGAMFLSWRLSFHSSQARSS